MQCLVTGAAGFIGSHLCESLLANGHHVTGIDAFIPYYPRAIKERNLTQLLEQANFQFIECDMRTNDLSPAMSGADVVFHLGAMGGLLASWTSFDVYMTCNILATYRVLEAARDSKTVRQFIHASTSSVYGGYATGSESAPLQPVSPYGITKLAAEKLVETFHVQYGLPTTILRYFSVYGPRQRPDMGYFLFIDSMLRDRPITIFGDGTQLRSNTYVSDIVRGTMLALQNFKPGVTFNIGGAEEVSLNDSIAMLESIIGRKAILKSGPIRPGEQQRAFADFTLAREELGYQPAIPLSQGLKAQVDWQRELLEIN